ncbi:hypothetical protein FOQG_16678 [Fusarium oxysporum f. sp. raphani 54005]|uniref:Uncharacterized protein n=1 Tax=Fusarium oxysporum f. sp. raphani 54005 TaxID=1089458 RepID=X0BJR7_FUSOX|nr:hypothetical protein FOQG_16678 [Fusarium oxysporum f. sp. raphani 54005]
MSLRGRGLELPLTLNQPSLLLELGSQSLVVVGGSTLVHTCMTDGHLILTNSHAVLENRRT